MPLTDVALIVSIANGCAALVLTAGRIGDRWRERKNKRSARADHPTDRQWPALRVCLLLVSNGGLLCSHDRWGCLRVDSVSFVDLDASESPNGRPLDEVRVTRDEIARRVSEL